MGLDLTMFPLWEPRDLQKTTVCCSDRLGFDRDYDLFDQLNSFRGAAPTIRVQPLPSQLWVEINEEDGIKRTREGKSGEDLTFVYVQQLKKLDVSNSSPRNKAIKAFVDALPDDTPIILHW